MHCTGVDIVFQEVPEYISICFSIAGCSLQCEGCHSTHLWKKPGKDNLTLGSYLSILKKYQGMADCVLFMGGEWHPEELTRYLMLARSMDYKTCLYTGQETVDQAIIKQLDFIKTGPWISKLGGLSSPNTNQVFTDLHTNKKLNHLFLNEPI